MRPPPLRVTKIYLCTILSKSIKVIYSFLKAVSSFLISRFSLPTFFNSALYKEQKPFTVLLLIGLYFVQNFLTIAVWPYIAANFQKDLSRVVLRKRCSENMQQIYRRTPLPKCDFNKIEKQLK